ncbi:hypothetical protein B0H16DRAFT_592550 [Mycena metata]|uniref:Uncharacterized protein n=1 Tax=Mycena metata TaxID=1033252 RepID=A0AAD7MDI0_9AGAR|nr:hypothetical protein B0H16DRAFT_592550 [Mycena metata]
MLQTSHWWNVQGSGAQLGRRSRARGKGRTSALLCIVGTPLRRAGAEHRGGEGGGVGESKRLRGSRQAGGSRRVRLGHGKSPPPPRAGRWGRASCWWCAASGGSRQVRRMREVVRTVAVSGAWIGVSRCRPKDGRCKEATETMWATRDADVDAARAVNGTRRALCARSGAWSAWA